MDDVIFEHLTDHGKEQRDDIFCGKTVRCKGVNNGNLLNDIEIEIKKYDRPSCEEGYYYTDIDFFLHSLSYYDADTLDTMKQFASKINRFFNMHENCVVSEMYFDANCIEIKDKNDPRHQILVQKKKTCDPKNSSADRSKYNGRYYDPSFIYRKIGDTTKLESVGNLYLDKPYCLKDNQDDMKISELSFRIESTTDPKNRCAGFILHDSPNVKHERFFDQVDNGCVGHYIVKFSKPKLITHFGIAGDKPSVRVQKSRRRVGKIRKSYGLLHILADNFDGSYVETFELSYKDMGTKKWINLGLFVGNANCFSENVICLKDNYNVSNGLYTNQLMIKPVSFHRSPVFRIAVYGFVEKQENDDSDDTILIKYTVTEKNRSTITGKLHTFKYDKYSGYPSWYWSRLHASPKTIRRSGKGYLKKQIREDLDDYYS